MDALLLLVATCSMLTCFMLTSNPGLQTRLRAQQSLCQLQLVSSSGCLPAHCIEGCGLIPWGCACIWHPHVLVWMAAHHGGMEHP